MDEKIIEQRRERVKEQLGVDGKPVSVGTPKREDITVERVRELRADGLTWVQVAKILNCSAQTAWLRLNGGRSK